MSHPDRNMANMIAKDGSSQDDRMLPALREGFFKVDEMRLEDLLTMASEHAGLLKYFDVSNRTDGTWKEFFDSDEVFVLASILALKPGLIELEFTRFMAGWGTAIADLRDGRARMDILPAFRLARKIDSWYVKLRGLQSVAAVRTREKIGDVIGKTLSHELDRLHAFMRQFRARDADVFLQLSDIWRRKDWPSADAGSSADRTTEQLLKSNFHAFYSAILHLQGCAGELLATSLGRQNHDPAIGLLITFLKLFSKAQDKLNGFTGKHLNFYYEEILKIQRRDFVPDSAHLILSPDIAGREVLIKSGTAFKAVQGNNELLYTADNDLLVNDAKVCSLHTLHFGRNLLSFPENELAAPPAEDGQARRFATSAKVNRIMDLDGDTQPDTDGMLAHPLFGVPPMSREHHVFEDARLGFAVASNVLLLKQGTRNITMAFRAESSAGAANPASSASGAGKELLEEFIGRLSRTLPNSSGPDAFFKAFRRMFNISLTGEKGWMEVGEYLPLSHVLGEESVEANTFSIQFQLPDSAGAVVPYSPAIHGERFNTELPVIKFAINPDSYFYPYSFLRTLVISEVMIEVDVTGCTDVKIYNQLGPLSASSQFNPFGPLPAAGDYLVIGSHEVAQKHLTSFDVDIEWGNLPQEMNGFDEYYRAYSMPFGNSSFKAALSVLRGRRWLPAEDENGKQIELFASQGGARNGNHRVDKKRRISFDGLCKLLDPIEGAPREEFAYDAQAKNGFFRVKLTAPEDAFGHKIYPMILSKVMLENARQKKFWLFSLFSKALPPNPLPNPPYAPLINAISINYKAVSSINLGRITSADENKLKEKMFHLHPFGLEMLSPKAFGNICLVPQYDSDGNLFIGLSASKLSGLLTLFFHLRDDSLPEAGARQFNFTWHYLSSNQWKRFAKSQVVSDTTNGFLRSGIVTLDMPSDIDRDNTVLPGGQYWIRVSVNDRHMRALCSFYDVHAQALKTTWARQAGNGLSHLGEKLPAGSISEGRHTIPGIAAIRQVMDSFGGRAAESDAERTVRVSERLKHKNRAITPWDYERLILQQFPEIYKVNCLPCMVDDEDRWDTRQPGHLLIVVIPHLKEPASVNMQPMVDALLLQKIWQFVKELSPSFAEIKVRNPDYELIQVRCKVKFWPGKGQGIYLNELNNAIVDYLSPWTPSGTGAKFGWRVRCNDIQSHIQGLGYVESVSGLSMLRVRGAGHNTYLISDTARERAKEIEGGMLPVDEVTCAHPWSIAVPFARHLIEVIDDRAVYQPEQTGIGKLAIGSTFILSRGQQ